MGTMTKGRKREAEAWLDCSDSRTANDKVAGVGLGAKQGRRSSCSGRCGKGNRVEARRKAAAANRVGGEHEMASERVQLLLLPTLTEERSGGGAGEAAAPGRRGGRRGVEGRRSGAEQRLGSRVGGGVMVVIDLDLVKGIGRLPWRRWVQFAALRGESTGRSGG
ncbi:hypothetical protein CFC21_051905 [Triticum aestivum]|uniref:Uncharacterized protein n=2 Tax=Triticum aestivum TaxID=4565 RepID=A0A3B6HSG0_WHEAT|nr:hypothetical protein CFC21_051905 [Triticum aestivum]